MTAAAFDTYTAAKRLRDAGFDESQTEAAVTMVREAVSADREQLATKAGIKADLAELRADMQADLRAAIDPLATKAELAALRAELGTIRWSVGLIAAFLFAIGLRVFGLI